MNWWCRLTWLPEVAIKPSSYRREVYRVERWGWLKAWSSCTKKKDQHDKNCDKIEYLYCNFLKKSINIIIITLAELHRHAYYCYYQWMEFMKVTLWLYVYKPGWNFTASCLTALKDLCSFLFRLQTSSFRFTYCWQAFDNTAHLFFVAHLSCSFLLHIRTLLCWWMQAGPLISGHFLKQSVRNGIAVN